MTAIRIRTLRKLDRREVRRLVRGYTSTQKYNVRKTEDVRGATIRLTRRRLARPFHKTFPLTREDWLRYRAVVRQGMSLGAYEGSALVGLVLAEPRPWNRSLWVWELGVAETRRRRGVGARLLEELARRARLRGLRTIVCETQTTNVPAIDFYRANAFQLEGIDLSYYSNEDVARGEVAIFMKRRLGSRR